jgi:hypothetical protein
MTAVLISAGRIRWHDREPLPEPSVLAESFARLVERAPSYRHRANISVALGPAWVQVKRLGGLPPVGSARLVSELVRQNERSFFLWRGVPAVIPDVDIRAPDHVRGAAFDRAAIGALETASRVARVTIRRVIPLVALGELPAPRALAALGHDALTYAGAFAAATARRRIALAWRMRLNPTQTLRRTRAMRAASSIGIAAALAFAAFGPGVRAIRATGAAEHELARQARARRDIQGVTSDLMQVSRRLARVDAFQRERGQVTRLLAALSEATPDSTAMLAFRADSIEGGLTVIAPRIADVLPALGEVHGVVSPRIIGSITREVVGGAPVERAAIRFRLPARRPVARRMSR